MKVALNNRHTDWLRSSGGRLLVDAASINQSAHQPACCTNRSARSTLQQSAPSTPQPISVGLFQRHLLLKAFFCEAESYVSTSPDKQTAMQAPRFGTQSIC